MRGKVPLAVRHQKVLKAGKYTAMSLARSVALMVGSVFKRAAECYTLDLHIAMSTGQSGGKQKVTDDACNALVRSVFKLFHIQRFQQFQAMWSRVARKVLGSRCSAIRVQSKNSVTWQTVLVHLCEVRQCVQKYGLKQLQQRLVQMRKATEVELKQVRAHHSELMRVGYAGGHKCHCVWMTEKAAEVV